MFEQLLIWAWIRWSLMHGLYTDPILTCPEVLWMRLHNVASEVSCCPMFTVMSHVLYSSRLLLDILYGQYFQTRLQCPFTDRALIGHTLLHPPFIRNRLVEEIVQWWMGTVSQKGKQALLNLPSFFTCTISMQIMDGDVYLISDGTSYSTHIITWLRYNQTSPLTRRDTRLPTTTGLRAFLIRNSPAEILIAMILQLRKSCVDRGLGRLMIVMSPESDWNVEL